MQKTYWIKTKTSHQPEYFIPAVKLGRIILE